ncbi:MAG: EAL domain-containing protein [Clostridia bacterium]
MPCAKTILVVDDNAMNRAILTRILLDQYPVLEAADGQAAIELLHAHANEIAAVLLDVVMPVMDGFTFLEVLRSDAAFQNLPVIVTTGNNDHENERKALSLGAWDFVSKPYDPEIIRFRLRNTIDRSQLAALQQLKYLAEFDALTGIYNKSMFFRATREMLDANPEEAFVFLRFDVDRFQLINSFFGTEEGDRLLKFIARCVRATAMKLAKFTYGRIESDIFCCCTSYQPQALETILRESRTMLAEYNPAYDIVPSIGIYVVEAPALSVETMYNCATLAAKTCKGNYVDYYTYYNESMSKALTLEQEITNEMNAALENEQFQIYLQPKYNIQLNAICGAEALVRWMHPIKGILSPGEFIPVFERNGFIIKLDAYVWEQACKCLRRWIDEGMHPQPISVNVSRVNLYNPKLVEALLQLVRRYQLEPALLNLELTESAYTDNPTAASETIAQLQSHGFLIMMDDFGSGYSSLNILKDIAVDVLKIDMRFLSDTKIPGRGENIITSVVRMAKWLNIPVITEGVETQEQMDFLRSIGCDYIQGYYFARPMPVADYEALCRQQTIGFRPKTERASQYQYDELFVKNPKIGKRLNDVQQAAAIYEVSENQVELLRVNNSYYTLFGQQAMTMNAPEPLSTMDPEYRATVLDAFNACVQTKRSAECTYVRSRADGAPTWIHIVMTYESCVGDKHIVTGILTDITLKMEIDRELQRYRASLLSRHENANTLLLVSDSAANKTALRKVFEDQFKILEADDGEAALTLLQERGSEIDLILLDLVMPAMDGKAFFVRKKRTPAFDNLPVVVITADANPTLQIELLTLGASDYIIRPFVAQALVRRVDNVMGFNRHLREMLRDYTSMSERIKTDQMTGLLNRTSAEKMISQQLKSKPGTHAMLMLDIDNFKNINDIYGHIIGDEVICAVAKRLQAFFRQHDIVARMGGDEFAAFIEQLPSRELAESRALELCKSLSDIEVDAVNVMVSCSVGIVISNDPRDTFELLYQKADKALYNAKCSGKGVVSVFGEKPMELLTKRICDAEGILNNIQDGLYICSSETHEVLYANDFICRYLQIDKKNLIGKKCYDALMHKTAPCEFCSQRELSESHVHSWIFHAPTSSATFLMRSKRVNWNGIPAHLEIAVDVTQIADFNNSLPAADDPGAQSKQI